MIRQTILATALALAAVTSTDADVLRVKKDAPDGGDGSSWESAYNDLQTALAAAQDGDELWVADGRYIPTASPFSFDITGNYGVYGGFRGTETERSQRNPNPWSAPTLSGDLDNDDTPGNSLDPDNADHVVRIFPNVTRDCILDGFFIQNGYANGANNAGRGGGIFINQNAAPTLENLILYNNRCTIDGGAIMVETGGTAVPLFRNLRFTSNYSNSRGGAVFNWDRNVEFVNCQFDRNRATLAGGAVLNYNSNSTYTQCLFTDNKANFGGAAANENGSVSSFINCSFDVNVGFIRSGDIHDYNSGLTTVKNSILWGATEDGGPSVYDVTRASASSGNNLIGGAEIGGIVVANRDPLYIHDTSQIFHRFYEDLRIPFNSPAIDLGDDTFNEEETDIAGIPRIQSAAIDIGAHEFVPTFTVEPNTQESIFADVEFLSTSLTPTVSSIVSDEARDAPASIATDGETLVVGLPFEASETSSRVGKAEIFHRVGNRWEHAQTLATSDIFAETDFSLSQFGSCVAVEGDRLAIGATYYTATEEIWYAGAVEIYDRDSEGVWQLTQRLDGDVSTGEFGGTLSLQGDELVVGGVNLYHYRLVEGIWQLAQTVESDVNYGTRDVDLDGDLIVADRNGVAEVYSRTDSLADWMLEAQLNPGISVSTVAVEGNTIVVGSGGGVAIFERSPIGWQETALITDSGTGFGTAIEIDPSEKAVIVGVANDEINGIPEVFSVELIRKEESGWTEVGTRRAVPANYRTTTSLYSQNSLALLPGEPEVLAIAKIRSDENTDPAEFSIFSFEPDNRSRLYHEHAVAAGEDPETNTAAFRYKVHLYGPDPDEPTIVIPTPENAASYYDAAAAAAVLQARDEAILALTRFPESTYYQDLLLDVIYDQTVAETLPAHQALENIDLLRINPPSNASGFVIDDEIDVYESALPQMRLALTHLPDLIAEPQLADMFASRTPSRSLMPATYATESGEVVATLSGTLLDGYKDADLYFQLLGRYTEAAAELAHLHFLNGDRESAGEVVKSARQLAFVKGSIVLSLLLAEDGDEPPLLDPALTLWRQGLTRLSDAAALLDSPLNPLGFSENFLVLFNRQDDENENLFNSFDILLSRIDNDELTFNQIVVAEEAQTDAIDAYDTYRGNFDTLDDRLIDVTDDAKIRLVEIVGAEIGTEEYEAVPGENVGSSGGFITGSELWQQFQNIERARLQIRRNREEMLNVHREVRIEIDRNLYEVQQNNAIKNVYLEHGEKLASIEESLANIEATQKAADALADALDPTEWTGIVANALNAGVQVGGEVAKGNLNAQKERAAAAEKAQVVDIENNILNSNSQAKVKTLMLELNTLQIDSMENAIALTQELGRLVGLYREKTTLEGRVVTHSAELHHRFFADPIHRLRFLYELHIATRRFETARQFTYFLARALEYKWNEPFDEIMSGSGYEFADIFRMRNATEVRLLIEAMEARDNNRTLPGNGREDFPDMFSLREDAFDLVGDSPETIAAFREILEDYLVGNDDFLELIIPFSTVRDPLNSNPASSFFRGPRNVTVNADGSTTAQNRGRYLDKIKTLQITIPGSHTGSQSTISSTLTYGGTGLIRSRTMASYEDYENEPDRLSGEFVAYPTLISSFTGTAWQTTSTLSASPTVMLRNDTPPLDLNAVDVFRERSVAANGWTLQIIVKDSGVSVLNLDEMDDIRIHFLHSAVTRQQE